MKSDFVIHVIWINVFFIYIYIWRRYILYTYSDISRSKNNYDFYINIYLIYINRYKYKYTTVNNKDNNNIKFIKYYNQYVQKN